MINLSGVGHKLVLSRLLNLILHRLGSIPQLYSVIIWQNFGIVLLPGRCLGFEDNFVRFGLGRSKFGDALQAFANIIKTF